MSRHEAHMHLRHMGDHAKEAVAMARGRTRSELDRDRQLNLSLVRLLEIVGEAADRVSAEERAGHPDIPWTEIVGQRNRLIDGYDSVDFDILWQTVSNDLPPLIAAQRLRRHSKDKVLRAGGGACREAGHRHASEEQRNERTYRFDSPDMNAAITNVYVRKSTFDSGAVPKPIVLTVQDEA